MATKAELEEEEVAVLKAKVAALETDAGGDLVDGTLYLYTDGIGFTSVEAKEADGQYVTVTDDGEVASVEVEVGVTYLYGEAGFVPVAVDDEGGGGGASSDEVAMLQADKQRLEIERNDARHQLSLARAQIASMGALHGRIDSLPGVVG